MKLLIYRGDTLERTLELSARDFRIGRAAENDVVLEDPEKTVSRFHAELRYENGAYALIDLNSQNGTWIEGERVRRTPLGPGQAAVMGNFRIALEDAAASAGPSADHDTLSGEMPQTLAMSPEAASALVSGADAGVHGGAAAAASGVPPLASAAAYGSHGAQSAYGVPGSPAASSGAAAGAGAGAGSAAHAPAQASTPKRAAAPPPQTGGKTGVASIPRPIFYGGVLTITLLIVGVMFVMRPHPQPAVPQPQTTEGGVGIESNEQIIARHLKDGRAKLEAGDTNGAIEAASRALIVDPNYAEALDLKMKAEERKRRDVANGVAPVVTGASTAEGASAASGTPGAATSSTGAPGAGTSAASGASGTPGAPGVVATGKPGAAGGTATQPGLTRAQRRDAAKKDQDLAKRYQSAKVALSRGDYAEAASGFDAIVKERPGYLDSASMLDQARGHIRTQAQQTTQQAAELAAKGDYASALQQYERARRLDPSLAGVDQGIANVRRQMKDAGDDAFKRARQLDAVGRAQAALPLYEKAVSLLPADDPNGQTARDRLEALKARNP